MSKALVATDPGERHNGRRRARLTVALMGARELGRLIARWLGTDSLRPGELMAMAARTLRNCRVFAIHWEIVNAVALVEGEALRYQDGRWYAIPTD